jgi:hypothetical protein
MFERAKWPEMQCQREKATVGNLFEEPRTAEAKTLGTGTVLLYWLARARSSRSKALSQLKLRTCTDISLQDTTKWFRQRSAM